MSFSFTKKTEIFWEIRLEVGRQKTLHLSFGLSFADLLYLMYILPECIASMTITDQIFF